MRTSVPVLTATPTLVVAASVQWPVCTGAATKKNVVVVKAGLVIFKEDTPVVVG